MILIFTQEQEEKFRHVMILLLTEMKPLLMKVKADTAEWILLSEQLLNMSGVHHLSTHMLEDAHASHQLHCQ